MFGQTWVPPKGFISLNTESTPSKVRDTIEMAHENDNINLDILDLKKLGFGQKPTKTNFCARPSSSGLNSMNCD